MNQSKKTSDVLSLFFILILLFGATPIAVGAADAENRQFVYAGGFPFGVRFGTGEVTIVQIQPFLSGGVEVSPATNAGLAVGDKILSVNGKKVESAAGALRLTEQIGEAPILLRVQHDNAVRDVQLSPRRADESGKYRIGILLKDSAAGIGTVTYVCPDGLAFAGLGHGICENGGTALVNIKNGYIAPVTITGIQKGTAGMPGELRGAFSNEKSGRLLGNTEVGLFGIFLSPSGAGEKISVATADEVKVGKATILCTLDDGERRPYDIEIAEINPNPNASIKNFVLRVTDKTLLEKTGGIVQGMSGSPILQDGKLVGAVTHVMINDPTTGYGIFIGNMMRGGENYLA